MTPETTENLRRAGIPQKVIPNAPSSIEARDANNKPRIAVLDRVSVRRGGDSVADKDYRAPDGDLQPWAARMLEAFGTSSPNFVGVASAHVEALIENDDQCEVHTNAALAIIDGLHPQNEAEALLVLQMIGAHFGAMKCFSLSRRSDRLAQFQVHSELANKFMRTYAAHLETLTKLRRGGEQVVRVEHVHVYSGGQAVVGDVNVERGEEVREFHEQPHAPKGDAPPSSNEVRSEDPVWSPVPGTRAKRKGKVPHARGRISGRAKKKQERADARAERP